MIMFSIDPGTGVNSACGIAVIRANPGVEPALIALKDVWPSAPRKTTMSRVKDIADQVGDLMADFYEQFPMDEFCVCSESFVMRGKGGETLQRFIGAVLTRVPTHQTRIVEVQNTSMKKFVGGTGKADKELVLKKVLIQFPTNKLLLEAAVKKQYDSIDAIGIGLTALEKIRCDL